MRAVLKIVVNKPRTLLRHFDLTQKDILSCFDNFAGWNDELEAYDLSPFSSICKTIVQKPASAGFALLDPKLDSGANF